MLRQILRVVVIVGCCVPGAAQAVEFEHVVSVGDSLLDDLLGLRSPLVSEQLADRLDAPLTQFARAGATSASLIRQGQHTSAASQFGEGDLATLWIGGNDFFLSVANPIGVGVGNFRFMDRLEENVDTILGTLASAGMEVLVFNLPDMTAVPLIDAISFSNRKLENISEATLEWNDRLADLVQAHDAHLVDVYSYFEEISSNPEEHTILGHELVFGPTWGCEWCVFADPIHPSALAQGLITNLAIDVLNADLGGTPLAKLSEAELADLADTSPLARWRRAFGRNANGDLDGDGDTDGNDFLQLQRQGSGAAIVAAVPEPGAIVCLLGLCGLFLHRRALVK